MSTPKDCCKLDTNAAELKELCLLILCEWWVTNCSNKFVRLYYYITWTVTCLLEHGCLAKYKSYPYLAPMKRAVDIAAGNGDLDILKVLRLNNCQFNENTGRVAVQCGHYECLEYPILKRLSCSWRPSKFCLCGWKH